MAEMSWSQAGTARSALRAIVSDPNYGSGALSRPRVMASLLDDFLPDAPREKLVLLAAVDARIAESLGEHISAGMDAVTAIRLSASSLSAGTAIEPDACTWAAIEFAVALGLINEAAATELGVRPAQDAMPPVGTASATRVPAAVPAEESTLLPAPAPAPVSRTAVLPYPPGQEAGAGQGGGRVRTAWIVGAVAAITAAVIGIWISGALSSGPPVQPLRSIIAPFAAQCGPASQRFVLNGVTSSYLCKRTTASVVDVLAYQFDNSADYQAGIASLNSRTGFRAADAARSCPPPIGTATGSVSWHAARYPARTGQVLECYTDAHNHLPLILWTLPSQRAIVLADDGAFGATLATLYDWWTAVGFG